MSSNGREMIPDLNLSIPDLSIREEICVTNTHQTGVPTQDVFDEFTTPVSGDGTRAILPDDGKLLSEKQRHQVEVPAQDACIDFMAPISRDVYHANVVVDVAGTIVPVDTETILFEKHGHQVEVPAQDECIGFTAPISIDVDHANGVADVAGAIVPADAESLLFEKHRELWKVAESFEACRKIPQDPHFLPLKSCSEILREGQALGKMVTFNNIAKKASKWHVNAEREAIEDDLSLLEELETHGFHVEILKNHLNQLLILKNQHEKFNNMLVQRKMQLSEYDEKKSKNKERIAKIEDMMKKLQNEAELAAKIDEDMDAKIAAGELAEKAEVEEVDKIKKQFDKLVSSRLY